MLTRLNAGGTFDSSLKAASAREGKRAAVKAASLASRRRRRRLREMDESDEESDEEDIVVEWTPIYLESANAR